MESANRVTSSTETVGEAVIISNEFSENMRCHRRRAMVEKENLMKVTNRLQFERLNESRLNGDISLPLWDHNTVANPTKCDAQEPQCIKCLIQYKAKKRTKYFLFAICSHGLTKDGDLCIALADESPQPSSAQGPRKATDCEKFIKLGDILRFLKDCEKLKTKIVILIIETCRMIGSIAECEDPGVSMEVAEDLPVNMETASNSTAQQVDHRHRLVGQETDMNVVTVMPDEQSDTCAVSLAIPTNYIVVFGTTLDRPSYSDPVTGSWLEDALSEEIEKYTTAKCENLNFLQFLTKVAFNVAKREVQLVRTVTSPTATHTSDAGMTDKERTLKEQGCNVVVDHSDSATISGSNVVPDNCGKPGSKCSIQITHRLTEPITFKLKEIEDEMECTLMLTLSPLNYDLLFVGKIRSYPFLQKDEMQVVLIFVKSLFWCIVSRTAIFLAV
ncbi:uncharacterized protein LOC127831348 [Dreissena polymorpha]|uniref:Peptidase C14 caspase domain-containing protein n=1 Tax=Dreissena polymorpha TaxID=45954 RepID=A0A9D4MRE4_DREPO|nr:uncharacterized protein LOC127831348 [Dreissena polymorpha]XP_052212287.1 uncharacterized protein LOC127831348 [Dreissena polymorpha]KAH3882472.1 hypothetical protein DPMN_006412 [Dreissena polymorpha]